MSTSTSTVATLPSNPTCPVGVVAAGSFLEPYVESLRGFRDKEILETSAGGAFMSVFNAWYYGWAPSLARMTAENQMFANLLRLSLVPLFGILYASYYSYLAVAPLSHEAGAITAGTVAASLIGLVYVAPFAYLSVRILRVRKHLRFEENKLMRVAGFFVASVVLIGAAYVHSSFALMRLATASFTLSMLTLGSIAGIRALALIQPSIFNLVPVLSIERLKRSLNDSGYPFE
jgi:hypothetical protein